MAKTTSQIVAENKKKRAEEAKIQASRDAIHKKQTEQTGAKNAKKTAAVLKKAGIQTKTNPDTFEVTAINAPTPHKKEILKKLDVQKKKEDRIEAKRPAVDSLQIKKDRADKALKDFDENEDFDATSARDRKRYDAERERLQAEVDRAGAEMAARENTRIRQEDKTELDAMGEEDRAALEQFAVNQIRDQNLPVEMQGVMPSARQEAAGLLGKYGNRAGELAETYMRQENEELNRQAQEKGRELAEDNPLLANAARVPVKLLGDVTGAVGQLQGAARGTGRYSTLDANETGTALHSFAGAVTEQTAQDIAGDEYDEEGNQIQEGGKLRELGALAYQGATSFIDSTARMLASGGSAGVSSAIAAMGSFSQGMQKYSAMGASPEKAAQAATVIAGLEYITNKLPTEEVLKLFHKGGGTGAVKEVLKQAFITEPLGEEVNLFAGILAEAKILGEQSGKAQRLGDLLAGGLTREQAEKQYWSEVMQEAAQTYAVSAFAGGLGAGTATIAGRQVQQFQEQGQVNNPVPTAPGVQSDPTVTGPDLSSVLEDTAAQLQPEVPAAPSMDAAAAPQQTPLQVAMEDLMGGTEQQEQEAVVSDSAADPDYYDEFEDFGTSGTNREEFLGRDWDEVGKRNVNAYMYENPEVKPYFQMEAQLMLMELADSTRGERTYNEDVHYESGGEKGWSGVKRDTSEDIAYLLDTAGLSYGEIEKGLNAIIKDNGAENNAASKRIEFILHNRLMNGHKDFYGDLDTYPDGRVPASEEYVSLINSKQITTYDNEPAATDDGRGAVGDNLTASANSPQTGDSETMPTDGGQIPTKGEKDGQRVLNGFASGDFRNSNTYMNTGLQSENANIRKGYRQELRKNPDAAKYAVKHNADTLAEAERRTGSPEKNAAALQDLLERDHWTPEDVATSTLLLDQIMASGDKAAISHLNALRQKRKDAGTYFGQGSQSFAINNPTMKAADSPATAVDTFRKSLDGMKQEETTWNRKSGVDFESWKNQIKDDVDRIGIAIATVEDGDSDSMRQIIRQIAQRRGTTAWFGTSQNLTGSAWSVLKKLDFQDLKKVANTQLVAMADDYRARGTGEVAKGLRKQSMLSSLKTFTRNIAGNTVGGFADAVSESGAGRMADAVLSQFTGKQTMGSDILRVSDYAKAAREAGQFASLCVELNIPIETDVDSSYSAAAGNSGNSKYLGKTFRATGNPAMRALYAYQKYMSYALEVTDKIFEGGTNAAVAESLNRLQGANLTQEEIDSLGKFTANKRTFKDATWESTEMVDGKEKKTKHGSELARFAKWITNPSTDTVGGKVWDVATDIAAPFPGVPMNVAQTGIDYTAGVVKSLGEMVSIIQDAKAGKTIPVERQRQAASDFGRGVTGTAMIAMFASAAAMGALKVSNDKDWDKEALAQAEGRSGAQINWSALMRGLNGEDAKWQSGDIISGMDFLEPFNTQMYLGAELSQADDFNLLTGAGATIKSVWQSLMDSPVMTGLADIEQTLNDISEAETLEDQLNVGAGYAGDVASSFVPQFVRQAAQNQDGYYRDTRGENALDSAINSFMAAIPGQSQKLPKKYSGLGEAQKRGGAVETFLDPTATKEFQQNEVTTFLDELSGKAGESANNIYPDRQAPMQFTYGDDRQVTLDGHMRETYQKTYGEKVNELYTSLINDKDFQGFSDELKIKALEEAKGYAVRYAKAAVSDYREAPIGTVQALAKGIVQREVKSQMDAFFTDLDTQREYGYSTEETAAKLEESFQAFQDLSKDTQAKILEQATSDTAKYLEVRQKGVSTEQFLAASQKLDSLKPMTGYKAVRDIQEWEAISNLSGVSDSGKDALIKAYMQDYDPTDKSPVKTELKYDYARQELGLTPDQFVEVYEVSTSGKKAEKLAEWQEMGFSRAEANLFYRLFSATGKTKIDVVDWYNEQ